MKRIIAKLDTIKSNGNIGTVKQLDNVVLEISLTENLKEYSIKENDSFKLFIAKPDKTFSEIKGEKVIVKDNKIYITIDRETQAFTAVGVALAELEIESYNTLNFNITINKLLSNSEEILSSNELSALEKAEELVKLAQLNIDKFKLELEEISLSGTTYEQLNEVRLYVEENLRDLTNQNSNASSNIDEIKTLLRIIDEKNTIATNNINSLVEKNVIAEKTIENINENISAADRSNGILTETIEEAKLINNTIANKNTEATENITSLNSKNATADSNIKSLDSKNSIASNNIKSLDSKNSIASTNITNLTNKISESGSKITELTTKNAEAVENLNNLNSSIEEAKIIKQETEALINTGGAATKEEVQAVESQLTENIKEVFDARTTVDGEECDSVDVRIVKDISKVMETIENITYIQGTETLDRTIAGELRDIIVEGATYQNLNPVGVSLCNDRDAFNHNYQSVTVEKVSNGMRLTQTVDKAYAILGYDNKDFLKPNTKYLAIADITINKLTNPNAMIGLRCARISPDKARIKIKSGRGLVAQLFTSRVEFANNNDRWISVGVCTDTIEDASMVTAGDSFTCHSFALYEVSDSDYNKPIEELLRKYPIGIEVIESVSEREMIGNKYQVPIKVTGKNLINEYEKWNSQSYYGLTVISEGDRVRINGKSTHSANIDVDYFIKAMNNEKYINVKPNTNYRISLKVHSGSINGDVIIASKCIGTNGDRWTSSEVTTLSSEYGICRLRLNIPNTTIFNNAVISMQLEENAVVTSYEQYKEQYKNILLEEPIRSVNIRTAPNVIKDIVYADRGYANRNIIKMDCFGIPEGLLNTLQVGNWTEDIASFYIRADGFGFEPYPSLAFAYRECYCNHFSFHNDVTTDKTKEGVVCVNASPNYIGFNIKKNKLETLDVKGFKKFLDDNKIFVIGIRKTPIKEEFSKVNLRSNDGKTYISTTNYIKPTVTAKALTNVSALLNDMRNENTTLKNNLNDVENETVILHKENIDTMAFSLALDFRLMDVEWLIQDNTPATRNKRIMIAKGFDRMRTQYDMMKTLIIAGEYEKEDMTNKVNTYHKRGVITLEQKEELLSLMEAREIIEVK